MVRVDFDRPGLDSAWTPEYKCAEVSPSESVPVDPYLKPICLGECQPTSSDSVHDGGTLPSPLQVQEPSKHIQSEVVVFEEQATVPRIEDAAGLGQDFENSDVVVEAEEELDKAASNVTLIESNLGQPVAICKVEEETKECKAQNPVQKDRRGLSCFNRLWEGLAKLGKPESKCSRFGTAAPDADSDLQLALLESASLHAKEISSIEARERLQRVLALYHAKPSPVQADGNCQFRALSQQLYGDESLHGALRAQVVERLEASPECYSNFVHEPYSDYIKRMACRGEWGDNVTLQAASDALGTEIHILTDVAGAEYVKIHPTEKAAEASQKPLCLTFLTELHYDAAELL